MQRQWSSRDQTRPTIGIVMRGFRRPDYDVWLSATEAAGASNLNVVTFAGQPLQSPVGFEKQANAIYELIDAKRLAGVVLLTSGLGLFVGIEGIQAFCQRFWDVPMVSVQMRLPGVPSILIDNYRGMREVVDHLIEVHGYRRIAFLRGPLTHRGARERYRAYVESLEAHGIPVDPDLVTPPSEGWDNRIGIRRFLDGLGGKPFDHCEAIAGTSASLAQQALEWLTERGVHVPEDVALTGFDDFPHLAGVIPPLTTTRVPFDEVGRRAISLLVAQMRGDTAPTELEVPAGIVIRQSCGCPSKAILRASLLHPGSPSYAPASVDHPAVGDALVPGPREALLSQREALIAEITGLVAGSAGLTWVPGLIDALAADLDIPDRSLGWVAANSVFLSLLKQVLLDRAGLGQDVVCFQDVISALRWALLGPVVKWIDAVPAEPVAAGRAVRSSILVEDLLTQARALASGNAESMAVASRFRMGRQAVALAQVGHTLTTVTDMEELKDTLAEELPKLGIQGCYVALYDVPANPDGWAHLHFACSARGHAQIPPDGVRFQVQDLLPAEMMVDLDRNGPFNLVAESLFVRYDQFGFILFGVGPRDILFEDQPAESTVYDLLRSYVSDALCGILLYDEAVRARQQAEEADRLKSRFLSMVSHELRTPLNLIVSVSEMLLWEQRGDQPELTRIHASAQHLDGLIRDVLDLASSQVGQLRLVREPLDLRQVLEVVILIGQQMALDKGLAWGTEIPDVLPKVWGDRTRLRQVALNLVSNAFRFTSEGEVRLSVELSQDEVKVSISDTGIGVPVEEQEAIFDEFRQSERTAARGYGGLGLGLAISRRLVEMHGGEIGVESTGVEGEGATFYFALPTMGSDQPTPPAGGDHEPTKTVLVLSDQGVEAHELSDYLKDCGYLVKEIRTPADEAGDGTGEWLNQVLLGSPRAVILGMKPASEHGWAVMKVLKENPETQGIPVLFYSLMQGQDSGSMLALDYLTKPISIGDLVQVLERQGLPAHGAASGDPAASSTFLIVDDEPDILATHTWLLQSQLPECRVLQAANGRQALELMAQSRPDLVLLDLMMPEMSGFEVIEHMQSHPDLFDIPIVVLTGKTLTDRALEQLNQGVTAVLGKGLFSAEETLHRLEVALRRSRVSSPETRKLARRAMAYVHEHYMESITRKEIAAHVNVSARHLDRCFSDEMGVTPMVYLNRFRLRQARRLLQSTALNISEIAAAVGFSDSSYFCRVFRRDLDMSPSDYRRTYS